MLNAPTRRTLLALSLGLALTPAFAADPRPDVAIFTARYDPATVNQLVRQAGLPVWGVSRPQTLVWLAVERDGQPELLGAGESAAVDSVVRSRSRARGLPVALPSLDGEDRSRVSAADVSSGAVDRVTAASRRYHAEVLVLGQARERVPGLWESRWTVVSGGASEQFNVDGDRLE